MRHWRNSGMMSGSFFQPCHFPFTFLLVWTSRRHRRCQSSVELCRGGLGSAETVKLLHQAKERCTYVSRVPESGPQPIASEPSDVIRTYKEYKTNHFPSLYRNSYSSENRSTTPKYGTLTSDLESPSWVRLNVRTPFLVSGEDWVPGHT